MAEMRRIEDEITQQIIDMLEKGTRPWLMPWVENAAGDISRPLRENGDPYRGINVVVLWMAAQRAGYTSPWWMTFRQAKGHGGSVRKGEKATKTVFWKEIPKKGAVPDGDGNYDPDDVYAVRRAYNVFNAAQIDNLPPRYTSTEVIAPLDPDKRIAEAEEWFASLELEIREGGSTASFNPRQDHINMPPFERFRSIEGYYSVLAHETVHWTGHPSRLDRDYPEKIDMRSEWYAREELVAEIGSAFISADLGIISEARNDHAAYVEAWLRILGNDRNAVFEAAGKASSAVQFLDKRHRAYRARIAEAAREGAAEGATKALKPVVKPAAPEDLAAAEAVRQPEVVPVVSEQPREGRQITMSF